MRKDKEWHLEATRGVAALVVVAYHCLLAFAPDYQVHPSRAEGFTFAGNPSWAIVNGPGAVAFFFVLSGYVLTRRMFVDRDTSMTLAAMLKRWPRLLPLVLASALLSWALLVCGFDLSREMATRVGSEWFAERAATITPSLSEAFAEGAWLTFLRGDYRFNVPLWTIHYEYVGSLVAFLMVLVLARFRAHGIAAYVVLGGAVTLAMIAHPFYAAFGAGVAYAYLKPWGEPFDLPAPLSILVGLMGFYLWLFLHGVGAYHAPLRDYVQGVPQEYVVALGALMMLVAIDGSPGARRWLGRRMGIALGGLSFPVYLFHVPVMRSLGAAVFLQLQPFGSGVALVGAVAVSFGVTLAIAWPLALLDRAWVRCVNRVAEVMRDDIPDRVVTKA